MNHIMVLPFNSPHSSTPFIHGQHHHHGRPVIRKDPQLAYYGLPRMPVRRTARGCPTALEAAASVYPRSSRPGGSGGPLVGGRAVGQPGHPDPTRAGAATAHHPMSHERDFMPAGPHAVLVRDRQHELHAEALEDRPPVVPAEPPRPCGPARAGARGGRAAAVIYHPRGVAAGVPVPARVPLYPHPIPGRPLEPAAAR
jgi:hypothetical protein